jgi:ABC-type bacteriocin/lantibiotic exporter with double-glycine peptidase domain
MKRNPPLPYEPLCTAADMQGLLDFPLKSQRTEWTCGPACVSMVAQFYGRRLGERAAAVAMCTKKKYGTEPGPMTEVLSWVCHPKIRERMTKRQVIALVNHKRVPVVVLWDDWKGHWAIIIAADRNRVLLADPANRKSGMRLHTWKTFLDHWTTTVADQTYHNLGIACYP